MYCYECGDRYQNALSEPSPAHPENVPERVSQASHEWKRSYIRPQRSARQPGRADADIAEDNTCTLLGPIRGHTVLYLLGSLSRRVVSGYPFHVLASNQMEDQQNDHPQCF
jgi:hypothetical protein